MMYCVILVMANAKAPQLVISRKLVNSRPNPDNGRTSVNPAVVTEMVVM